MKKRAMLFIAVLALLMALLSFSAMAATTYSDIQGNWAEPAIQKWSDLGIVQGSGGKFFPNDPITRADVAVIIDRIMHYQFAATNSFTDLGQAYYTDAVLKANAAGVILGSGGSIRPLDKITREEAAVMLGRALGLKESAIPTVSFTDFAYISPWAIGYVSTMAARGIVHGVDSAFNPKAYITRAEIVTILNNSIPVIYGTSGIYMTDVQGIAIINAPGVTLKNLKITGDLIISQGVGSGDVTLDGINVTGTIIVRLSDTSKFHISNSVYGNIVYDTSIASISSTGGGGGGGSIGGGGGGSIGGGSGGSIGGGGGSVSTPITAMGNIVSTPKVGVQLTAGALTPADATASYQWKISSDGSIYIDIVGATSNTYIPAKDDVSKFLEVVATGSGQFTGSVTSAPTTAIAPSSINTLSSSIGTVDNAAGTITGIPPTTTLASFKSAITPAPGATFNVYQADGITAASDLKSGYLIIVTAQDKTTTKTYTLTISMDSDARVTTSLGIVDNTAGTIIGVPFGTTLADFKASIVPATGATFQVYKADGATPETVLVTGDLVIVTSKDLKVTKTYIVTMATASSNTMLTTAYAVDNIALTITGVPYGTLLSDFIANVHPAAGASFQVYQANGVTLAADLKTGYKIIVTAADGVTQQTYTVSVLQNSDWILTSAAWNIDNSLFTIEAPVGTGLAAFKAAISAAPGGTFQVYQADGTTVATDLQNGYLVLSTAQDGISFNTYTVVLT